MTIKRLEFKTRVKLAILRRAGFPESPICEGCGRSLRGERIEVDHTLECWEKPDRTELTAEDGKALGAKCCHKKKTAEKAAERAHGTRIIKKAAGIGRKGQPIPGSRASNFKRHLDGTISRRQTSNG